MRYFRQLQQWQWTERERLLRLQRQRLRDLLEHAHRYVPYYREKLGNASVMRKSGEVSLANFDRIPLLDKSIIRSCFKDLKSKDMHVRQWHENTSGGSTGEPVRFVQDADYRNWSLAIKMLDDLWSGYTLCEKKIVLWGSERDLLVNRQTLKSRISRWIRNEQWFNSFRLTPGQMLACVKKINAVQPRQILAYAESIYELARYIESEGMKIDRPPRAIMTSAGTLYPHMRESIERIFKAPVFNRYGSREVGDIACECEHHAGLHVSALTHFVEILRADGTPTQPGEVGEIVITLLTNYAMPVIRYRIGDLGAWAEGPCPCGRSWPLLKEITGRTTDTFIAKNGAYIHAEFFAHLFYFHDWVKRFQVIQEDYDRILLLLSLREHRYRQNGIHTQALKTIVSKIKQIMGEDCEVKYRFVDEIAPAASGKWRYTISKVAQS